MEVHQEEETVLKTKWNSKWSSTSGNMGKRHRQCVVVHSTSGFSRSWSVIFGTEGAELCEDGGMDGDSVVSRLQTEMLTRRGMEFEMETRARMQQDCSDAVTKTPLSTPYAGWAPILDPHFQKSFS